MGISDEIDPKIKDLCDAATAWFARRYTDDHSPRRLPDDQLLACTGIFNNDLSTLTDKFRTYYDLDTYDFGALSKELYDPDTDVMTSGDITTIPASNSVYGGVLNAIALVNEVRNIVDVANWGGRAANAFANDWCVKFGTHAGIQAMCCRELSAGAMAYKLAVDTTKAWLNYAIDWAIADFRYDGSNTLSPGTYFSTQEGEGVSYGWLPIITDAAAAVAAFPEELAAKDIVGVLFGVAGAEFGIIGEGRKSGEESGEDTPPPIETYASRGSSPDPQQECVEGLIAVYNWLTKALDGKIAEFDENLDRDFQSDTTGPFTRADINVPVAGLDSGTYAHGLPQGRDPDSERVVVTSLAKLYYAGDRTFPLAAGLYESARGVVSQLKISGPERQFPRSVATYNGLVADLLKPLKDTEDELSRCGTALTTAARNYAGLDASEAKKLQENVGYIQLEALVNSVGIPMGPPADLQLGGDPDHPGHVLNPRDPNKTDPSWDPDYHSPADPPYASTS